MKGTVRVVIAATVVVGLLGFGAAPASATHVTCGQTITKDTTLDGDLIDCPGDGIVIGADKITLDLNGYTIAGRGCTGIYDPATCVLQDGIVNTAGHDGVVVENGTIARFTNGILISDGDRNRLVGLHIDQESAYAAPGVGISMVRSDRSRVSDSDVGGGNPAILLSNSDRNTIEDTHAFGAIAEHFGDGLGLLDGSDANRLIGNTVSAEGHGIFIDASGQNQLEGNTVGGIFGNVVRGSECNVIVKNRLSGGRTNALDLSDSNDNRIKDNAVTSQGSGFSLSGDRNVVESNSVTGPMDGFGVLVDGSDNLIRNNTLLYAGEGVGIVIAGERNVIRSNSIDRSYVDIEIGPAATGTVVEDNLATRANDDGIHVDAPGTLIRRNVANDNGDLGIEAVEGVIDGGGNRASGNGNPLQCLNVFCKAVALGERRHGGRDGARH
jgi:large repetitive protein